MYANPLTTITFSDIIITYSDITDCDIESEIEGNGMQESRESGALTEAVYYILLSLYTPLHGYAIMQNIQKLSGGRVTLGAGTLYGAVNTLLEKRWIESVPGEKETRKKEYVITSIGREAVLTEIRRLKELIRNGALVTEGGEG